MSTDLEADLRREFDAAGAPSDLTFNPKSVLSQGNRTIRRHRMMAVGSAAMAVAVVATGASLLTRPHDTALPLPATRTATTGIFLGQVGFASGTFEAQFQLDSGVATKVRYFAITPNGQRQEVGSSSTGKPGQDLGANWASGMVDGHPATIGLVPSAVANLAITITTGPLSGYGSSELEGIGYASTGVDGTGYTIFAVDYPASATRPEDISSIRWSGATGIVDGIEGERRLTGRILAINKSVSVEVLLRPGEGGRDTVLGRTLAHDDTAGTSGDLSEATTDAAGVAVVTGRQPMIRPTAKVVNMTHDGPPIAAGILPAGASEIGVILTTNEPATGSAVQQRLPDGRVIFAIKAESAHPTDPSKDSIKAVTWTNADGTQGRMDVTQKQS